MFSVLPTNPPYNSYVMGYVSYNASEDGFEFQPTRGSFSIRQLIDVLDFINDQRNSDIDRRLDETRFILDSAVEDKA